MRQNNYQTQPIKTSNELQKTLEHCLIHFTQKEVAAMCKCSVSIICNIRHGMSFTPATYSKYLTKIKGIEDICNYGGI